MANVTIFDLKTDELLICELDRDRGLILSKNSIPISPGDIFPADPGRSFSGDGEYYLSVPASLLNFRVLEMPFSDLKKLRDLLPFELDGLVLNGSASIVFDACILGESADKYRVLTAYIAKPHLKEILGRLKGLGVDPRAVFSIELSHAVSSSPQKDVTTLLLEPDKLSDDSRASICLDEIRTPKFNFRRSEFAYTADTEKQDKALRVTAVLAILLIFIFLADAGINALSLKHENQSVREDIRKTYQNIFPNEKKITDEVYQMKAHLKELKDKETSFAGIPALRTLLDLTKVSRPGVSLSEVTIDRDLIVIKGECPSLSDAQRIKTDLEAVLSEVNISETKPSSRNSTQFTMTAKGRKT
jgi:type II secretory pathway component PulL